MTQGVRETAETTRPRPHEVQNRRKRRFFGAHPPPPRRHEDFQSLRRTVEVGGRTSGCGCSRAGCDVDCDKRRQNIGVSVARTKNAAWSAQRDAAYRSLHELSQQQASNQACKVPSDEDPGTCTSVEQTDPPRRGPISAERHGCLNASAHCLRQIHGKGTKNDAHQSTHQEQ